jgi:hypothetical protein
VTDRLIQDNNNLEIFGFSDSHASHSNLDVSSYHSRSDLNTGRSFSEINRNHVNLVDIRNFQKQKRSERVTGRKKSVSALFTDTLIKVASVAEVEARAKAVKYEYNKLFSDSQGKL